MTSRFLLGAGLATLGAVWLGPLPGLAPQYFSAHMAMHMGVVAIAAPLIALGLARGRYDPAGKWPRLFSAVQASVLELVVVWAWHAPALHYAARHSTTGLVAEQGMFLVSGLLVWSSAVGGDRSQSDQRAGAGVVALLLTSMHMTLLGALLALSPRPLYAHGAADVLARSALGEQHLGGAIMLIVGGVSYLAGGLWLAAGLLTPRLAAGRPQELR
jgi:putative membrane protein